MTLSVNNCVIKVKTLVDEAIKNRDPKTIWIIFDIDGTLLTDRNIRDKYRDKSDPFKWMYKGIHEGIKDMIALYNWCSSKGLNMCLITGRVQSLRNATIENLKNVGLKKCHRIYFKPNGATRGANKVETGAFKAICRKEILEDNPEHIILCNIGDQDSDFQDGYADHDIKILYQ